MSRIKDYAARSVIAAQRQILQDYLEAQYHIRHLSLIAERRCLFEEPGEIFQLPYVEATPIYEPGATLDQLEIPAVARQALTEIADLGVGIPDRPYTHQSEALEAFLGEGKDLVVATGTGSGKTESFLMPIIGELVLEAATRPQSAARHGCRALLLYPMNALVNDQLGRLRKVLGDVRVADILERQRGRIVRFGSYTSRTPYAGVRTAQKDERHLTPMFEDFYLKHLDSSVGRELAQRGRWPSKDIAQFYGIEREEIRTGRDGKDRRFRNWGDRLKTQPRDRELFTRHEMHLQCPDVLITNYSMLEYMLMRPIERGMFEQTRLWLESDAANQFVVVLDEAHMYRGAAGAEVALLLRRLHARLGVPRERIRYILTSASLGTGMKAAQAVIQFAKDLTGVENSTERDFRLVRGTQEKRTGARPGTTAEGAVLAGFDLVGFHAEPSSPSEGDQPERKTEAIARLAEGLVWPSDLDPAGLRGYVFERLVGFGPLEDLIRLVSGNAVELEALAEALFPSNSPEDGLRATEALLALGAFAQCGERVLLPTRLHLFYRGVPALYACINRECDMRRDSHAAELNPVLGRLYTHPDLHCKCSGRGRIYELLTHRDCGAAFIRAYVDGPDGDFLWHEPSSGVGDDLSRALYELHLLVDGEAHPRQAGKVAEVWIDIASGRLVRAEPSPLSGWLRALIPADSRGDNRDGMPVVSFNECPVCQRGWRGRSKIMDLGTKGEQPFANLVKAQVLNQPARYRESSRNPNGGRKSLLFSDGRQKAARLARDIPREVELDSFRQAIALAVSRIVAATTNAKLTDRLYIAFVSVVFDFNLHLFDGDDRATLRKHVETFKKEYDNNFQVAVDEDWQVRPPSRYTEALLRQLCSPYYSLAAASVAYVEPARRRSVQDALCAVSTSLTPDDAESSAFVWCSELLTDFAFDEDLADGLRANAAGYEGAPWGSKGKFSRITRDLIRERFGLSSSQLGSLEEILREKLCTRKGDLYFLDPNKIALRLATDEAWWQCQTCTTLAPVTIRGHCTACGGNEVHKLVPGESEYLRSRKGFLREPVIAALSGNERPVHITAEEHTAQLSQRDGGGVFATTEKYELRFQDLEVGGDDAGPIDVLSSTTTMEVGVDIGSLVAVGLRNVPPQRENYQQRAGRAGRRGAAVSTVITYAQGGPHDSHYFNSPSEIVSGPPRLPAVKVDNEKIARRHLHSYLIQTFFQEAAERETTSQSAVLHEALGRLDEFFSDSGNSGRNLVAFDEWVARRVLSPTADLLARIASWIPAAVAPDVSEWVRDRAGKFVNALGSLHGETLNSSVATNGDYAEKEYLLNFLFDHGLLPSYAFPVDLCEFRVEEWAEINGRRQVRLKEKPQQSIRQAISEYAPGRLLVIDKRTYRSGGVTASTSPTEVNRAEALFQANVRRYVYCSNCSYVEEPTKRSQQDRRCPICGSDSVETQDMLIPQCFTPEHGKAVPERDREQEFTYATSAQFPVPVGQENLGEWKRLGVHGCYVEAPDQQLVVVNRGKKGTNAGFFVCDKCGCAAPADPVGPPSRHDRPYLVQYAGGNRPGLCDGMFRRVFLGTEFRSDLLLLRVEIEDDLNINMSSSLERSALEDALRTLSEALLLSASRVLDLDAAEFSAGYRIVPGSNGVTLNADLYLFDTLAGGAGYADQAGREMAGILDGALRTLEECPRGCARSCYDCLRNYQNQFWHERLDRHLAAALLKYMRSGEVPRTGGVAAQSDALTALGRMLTLDGNLCQEGIAVDGCVVPLLVDGRGGNKAAIGTYHGLLSEQAQGFDHHLYELDGRDDIRVRLLSEYMLSRNLPGAYQIVKECLD